MEFFKKSLKIFKTPIFYFFVKRHYIIDGYNALFAQYAISHSSSIRKAREQLIDKLIDVVRHHGVFISIVFDAHEYKENTPILGKGVSRQALRTHKENVEIIFTGENETADQFLISYFKQLQRHSSSHKSIILVTGDKPLYRSISSLGFPWITIEDFFSLFAQKQKKVQEKYDLETSLILTESAFLPQKIDKKPILPIINPRTKRKTLSDILPSLDSIDEWNYIFENKLREYEAEREAVRNRKKRRKT